MWYEGGQIRREIDYHNNLYDGNLITYWENKQLKRQDLYKAGKLIDGKCFTIEGYKEGDYFPYERKPEFPGGENNLISFVSRNLRYARDAQEARIQGKVIMTFVIDTVGQVTDIIMKKSLYPSLDMEAYRVISIMPKWKPCMIDGEIIKCKFTFPIGYRLE